MKMTGFGDFLVRLSPPGYQRFLQAKSFDINYTGAEANACVALAHMGVPTEFVTRLPQKKSHMQPSVSFESTALILERLFSAVTGSEYFTWKKEQHSAPPESFMTGNTPQLQRVFRNTMIGRPSFPEAAGSILQELRRPSVQQCHPFA